MGSGAVVAIIIAVVLILFAVSCIKVVPQATTFIIELPPSGAPTSKSMFFKVEATDGK